MKCNHCPWEMQSEDSFCSWCGQEVTQIIVREKPIRLYVDQDKPNTQSAQVLTNGSAIAVTLQCINPPEWLEVTIAPTEIVEPDEQLTVSLRVHADKLDSNYKEDELVFRPSPVNGDSSFKDVKVKVQVWPVPKLGIAPLTVYTGRTSATSALNIDLTTEINIKTIAFDPPYIALSGGAPLEMTELGPGSLPIQLKLPDQINFQTQTINYNLLLEDLEEPLTGQFNLVIKKSATWHIQEQAGSELTRKIIPGLEEELSIIVRNIGEEVLEIKSILITPPDSQAKVTLKPAAERFSIEPGQQTAVTLKALAELGTPDGSYFFNIAFKSNDPGERYERLNIKVKDEQYEGFIAFDFGTTDSAVARLKTSDLKPVSVYLEGVTDPKIYSNIVFLGYKKQDDPPYKYHIGRLAKNLGSNKREREHFVKAIKTKIGKPYKVQIDFKDEEEPISCNLKPEQIVELIVRRLLEFTRASLRSTPTSIILSVPTRFTKHRKTLIKQAFEQAAQSLSFKLVKVDTIDESLAAGLFYIMLRGPNDELVKNKASYTMMILDFGGGTTDVTVFKVHQEVGKTTRVKDVEIIGAWGDATLGGEGITTEIAELLASRFLSRKINPESDAIYIKQLEDEAENAKLAISELLKFSQLDGAELESAISDPNSLLGPSLSYVRGGESFDDAALRSFIDTYQSNGHQLEVVSKHFLGKPVFLSEDEVINAYKDKLQKLRDELNIMMRKIAARQENAPEDDVAPLMVDVLLLAGQSSQFPMVKDMFQNLAKDNQIDFVRNNDGKLMLKECVSMGALYWTLMKSKLNGAEKVWDRIGRTVFAEGIGPQFEEVIPWGATYPGTFPYFVNENIVADRIVLEVYENLSMNNDPLRESYRRFELEITTPLEDAYLCQLSMDKQGEIKAQCYVQDKWIDMDEKK